MAEDINYNNLLPAYNYRVTIMNEGDAVVLSFAEISGLSVENRPVTYKHGMSFVMGSHIISGMRQPIRLTLKRGMAKDRGFLHDWFDATNNDPFATNRKRDIVVDLCDISGAAVIRWTAQRTMPIKLETSSFDAMTNDVSIETLEVIAHGLLLTYDP